MSGRIEIYDSRKEQTSKWSQNEAFSVREAGVDIGKNIAQGGSDVSVDQVVTSGREVAGITVDGERTAILIPNAGEWTQSDWAETDPSDDAYIKNKPNLASVATSGSYADLSNIPDLSDFVEDANYVHTDYNYDLGAKNIVDHVTDNLAGKVDKVSGKVLSDNNFTNAQKDKLTNLADIYGVGANLTLDPETNILSANAQPITIDSAMSTTSENAVQNKVITAALGDKVDKVSGKGLSANDFTNAYKDKLDGIDQGAEVNDISTISVNGVNVPADANKNVNLQISSSEVNDGILTITQDGTTLGSFTANQSSNSTIDIPAGGGCHVIENTSGTQMTSRSNLQFTGGSEVSDDSENDRTVVRVAEGVETSSYAYSQLSQAEKNDPLKIYFLNDSVPHDVDTPIDVSDFSHKKENNMTISVFAKQLIYKYDGFGGGIGASSYDPIAIPAEATKIKFKFTTGNSYSTTNVKHKITIGVKAVYQQTQFVFPDDTDWLVQKTYNTRYDTVEDYIDISSVTTPCYLMMCGHGWDVTFENFWETELESGGNTKIMYENVPYGDTNAGEWTQSDWAETDPSDDAYIKNKPSLATVATSGSYEDLSDQPDLSIYISDPNYTHTDNNFTNGYKGVVDGIDAALDGKVDKVSGKGLSTNDFTNAYKDKLDGIDQGAEVNDISTISVNGVNVPADVNKNVNIQISSSEVNDGILTITQDGTTLGSFTANQSSNSTIDIPAGGGGLLPHLIIITETGESAVKAVKGQTEIIATETSTGHYECNVTEFGTWTIHAILNGDDATVNLVVDTVKVYTVDDSHFHADITVNFPVWGATCNLAGQGESYYATSDPYTFTVHSAGTYTITVVEGSNTYTDTVEVTAAGQIFSKVVPLPDDAPSDDINYWLWYGGIDNSEDDYSSLADILADANAISTLMASQNAVDYMVRSTTWATNVALVPVMTDDTHPSGVASAGSSYSGVYPYYAFDGNADTYWQNNANFSYDYVQYDFGKQTPIKRVDFTAQGNSATSYNYISTLQGSNDGVTFTSLTTEQSGSIAEATYTKSISVDANYRYYRLNNYRQSQVTVSGRIKELQFYAPSIVDSETAMTYIGLNNYASNTLLTDATWREAICNSEYLESVLNVKVPAGGTAIMTAGSWAYTPQDKNINNIFDGDTSTSTYTTSGGFPWGMGYHFDQSVKIVAFRYFYATGTVNSNPVVDRAGHKFRIRHSDDGTTWTDISSFQGDSCVWWDKATPISEDGSHEYYDIYLENNNLLYGVNHDFTFTRINELQFYGRKDV